MKKITHTIFLVIFLCGSCFLSAEVKLPDLALSLSATQYQKELAMVAASPGGVVEFLLPELAFAPGETPRLDLYHDILKTIQTYSIPVERVWLRFKLTPPPANKTAPELELAIADSVTKLVQQIDFKYEGVLLDADVLCKAELVRLTLANFAVNFKAAKEELQMAVMDHLVQLGGEKITAYVDRLVLTYPDSLPNISRRFTLPIRGEAGIDLRQQYFDVLLHFPTVTPDTILLENLQPDSLAPLLTMIDGLQKQLPTYLEKADVSLPFFKLLDSADKPLQQMIFTDATLSRAVVLAHCFAGTAGSQQLTFLTPAGDTFKLTTYEPINDPNGKGNPVAGFSIVWAHPYILVKAEKKQEEGDSVGESITVSARAELSLEEIIARWQRQDKRQKKEIQNYLANTEMDMHFEPPNLGAGFDVSLHFRYFWDNTGVQYWEQTSQYLNGIKLPGKRSFPLPQLEPEQVVTQPLELNLVENYIYQLEDPETVDGVACYVLSFQPRPGVKDSLYAGKIWIDQVTFRKVQFLLVQSNCSGSILSNREMQHYQLVSRPVGEPLNLLVKSEVEQKVLAAGREFLLERRYRFKDIVINAPDYDFRLKTAVQGKFPMFTESKAGLREYVLTKDGSRQVKDKVTSFIWSLVTGVLYDDTANFPIPFVGVSSIDYNFLKTKAQLSTLLVVPFLAVNLTRQYKGNVTLGADLALSAVPRNDQVYRDNQKQKEEALYIFSGNLGVRARWQPFRDLAFTWSHYLMTEIFVQQKDTAEAFQVPRDGFTYNTNLDLEYSRKGYTATLSYSFFNRFAWRQWGYPGTEPRLETQYGKYYGALGKRFYIGSFTRIGLDLAYYGGYHLDRFSTYQPSLFSGPKIRGVSGSAISLAELGVASVSLGFTAFDVVRFDLYYNFARGREFQATARNFQGLELDFGTVGPWGSYMQGRLSYALAGPLERYNSRWSVYVMMFFPFKK